jgi:hypothetical protein
MFKKIGLYATAVLLGFTSVSMLFISSNAGATGGTKFSVCSGNELTTLMSNNTNWLQSVLSVDSSFDLANDPYIMFQTPTDVSAISGTADNGKPQNGFTMYRVPKDKDMSLINNTSTSDKLTYTATAVTIYHFFWRPKSSTYVTSPEYGTYPSATSTSVNPITLTAGTNISCVVNTHLIGYAPGYAYDYLPTDVKIGVPVVCPTDPLGAIACTVSNAFKNVTNDIKSVFTQALNSIGSFFIPDKTYIQAEFSSLNSFLTAKLGVLYWPFTIIPTIFNSFSDTSNTWCNTSTCQKDISGIYGHTMTINFYAIKDISPSFWALMTNIIKALVVLELLFLLRNKYMSVVQK